jgi:hypothetical protein
MKVDDVSLEVQGFMSGGKELSALIDLIYEAVLDNDLWPSVLIKLADDVGAAHVVMPSVDWRAKIFATIAPRDDPDLVASYKEYWAFRDPLLWRATFRPVGERRDAFPPVGKFILSTASCRERSSPQPRFLTSGGDRPSIVSQRRAPI